MNQPLPKLTKCDSFPDEYYTLFAKPIHAEKSSYFDTDYLDNPNFGLSDLLICLMVFGVVNDSLASLLKYGLLFDPFVSLKVFRLNREYIILIITQLLTSIISIELIFSYEKSLSEAVDKIIVVLEYITILSLLIFPPLWNYQLELSEKSILASPVAWCIILTLKLISYVHTNSVYRQQKIEKNCQNTISDGYPGNLNRKDLYYFIIAPTVCYEIDFPRNKRIRKRFIFQKTIGIILMLIVTLFISQQILVPCLINLLSAIEAGHRGLIIGHFFKLCRYVVMCWFMGFYAFFHCWLNILAELLHFADRTFYRDWWNATSTKYFWQNWNIPVHQWCKRHLMVPFIKCRLPNVVARSLVFLISGFLHEYLVSVLLGVLQPWMFLVMMAQSNSWFLASPPTGYRSRNLAFWVLLCFSQGCIVVLYSLNHWQARHELIVSFGVDPRPILNAVE